MLKVQEYLLTHTHEQLTEEFGIDVKPYDYDGHKLFVYNYDQIESPKNDPIVKECRGLILDDQRNILCRPFERFFNLGESDVTVDSIDWNNAEICEKVDGSLIKIWFGWGKWFVGTRGTAFADSSVNGFDITFKELVFKALNVKDDEEFQERANNWLEPDFTYLFEVTAMENRVVTPYSGYTLHYLAARDTDHGNYVTNFEFDNVMAFGAKPIRFFQSQFATVQDCVEAAKVLSNLQEGYVVYDRITGAPIAKIKSPAYVAVHHLRGEGLNPKRIAELVLTGEQDEYLKYFPEDREHVQPYVDALETNLRQLEELYEKVKHIENQKDFALAIKDHRFSSVLFTARKNNVTVMESWKSQKDSYKLNGLIDCVKGG